MQIAFNTANLVGRVTGYRFALSHWSEQHRRTIEKTDEAEWRAICREVRACGYTAVEVWEAHASPEMMTPERIALWKSILDENELKAIAYAGQHTPATVEICRGLRIDLVAGGTGGRPFADVSALARESGVLFCFENHPQKSVQEIVDAIEGGNAWVGVAVDTGWLGTQGVDAPDAIRRLGSLVRHVHVKDVKAPGGHETVALGEGCVDIAGTVVALKEIGYSGWLSWEDEPEDRNPFDTAIRNREWIERHLAMPPEFHS
jgi:sugar phosphate isomerase/epimerase